ncbi:hypothetical protein EHO61_07780 [Leptospira fluminis]|uniref:Uncharacterized protein n=2 Tax=Leptospira TaxID=171 RepID=A0A4R9GRA0_9LEPT|nr:MULTISPECIES: hypothetical protein [Leptospira]TGK14081.1 hypothetical protein EHO60_01690 [Leptospira fletcheri]TGK19362.1 hypothetical protein EHO61_07780 [Leptospira fluminis]
MKSGDKVKLTKRSFLLKGVIVLTGAQVEIQEIDGDKVVVLYNDREGYPHTISDLSLSDLAPLD